MTRQHVVVGMSGGVDSSVAAWLLKQQGYRVTGLFMKNWEDDDNDEYCSTRQDLIDATAVADLIGIDIEAVNFSAEYKDRVFAGFLREYGSGRTPNPDVLCNAEIKFKAFLDHAMRMGADRIATGHYARIHSPRENSVPNRIELRKALDLSKDQSYFLYRLDRHQLASTLFPLGELVKTRVREMAAQIGLPNARKKDSTGICFIGERPFRDFLNRYLPTTPGPMKTPAGKVVGEHMGLAFYTLGQRKGIGLGGVREMQAADGTSAPWFVAAKDLPTNTLYVAQGHDHPWLLSRTVYAENASWIEGPNLEEGYYSAKTRYRQADARCRLRHAGITDNGANRSFTLEFDQPQWAVTPGQSAVLYRDDVCVGGGIIAHSRPDRPGMEAPVADTLNLQTTSEGKLPARP